MARTAPPGWSPGRLLDLVGLTLVVASATWVAVVAGHGEGRRGPVLALLAGMTAAVAIGRALAARPGLAQRLVAGGIAGAAVLTWPGLLSSTGPPTGYANANATLTALGALAALGAARTAERGPDRRSWSALAGLLVLATAAPTSLAGVLGLAAALGLLAVTALARRPEVVVVGGLVLVSACLGVTSAIAAGGDPAGLGGRSEVRGELWAGAVEVLRDEPVRGVGPGRFEDVNPASDDRDLRWAHHGYLQVGAEWGAPGLLLVLGLTGWTWGRLWLAASGSGATAALGAAAALVVGLHATVDYVWHLPVVLLVLALLVGDATAAPAARSAPASGRSPLSRSGAALARTQRRVTAAAHGTVPVSPSSSSSGRRVPPDGGTSAQGSVGSSRPAGPGNPGLTPPSAVTPWDRTRRPSVRTRMRASSRSERWSM